jgi:TrmH family RNA methyltransferase
MRFTAMALASTHIVLVRPRRALNLGGVARALKNFGIRRLTLVASEIGSWSDAWRMAVKADDVLQATVQTQSLDDAIADAKWVVGTTNRGRPGQRVLSPRELAAEAATRGAPTILFGDENSGLSNHELLRCHDVSTIATAPEQSSLNLAQAVLIYAHELFAAHTTPTAQLADDVDYADDALLQLFAHKLGQALATSAWADAHRDKNALAELVQPMRRARPTRSEVLAWLTALGKVVQR